MLGKIFREFSICKLNQLAGRIDTCLSRLDDDQIWTRASENENAIGNLVLHLVGNLRQRILADIGGSPDIRQRDLEFNAREGIGGTELGAALRATVAEAVYSIGSVSDERLTERIVVQQETMTVLEAIYQVVQHFALHAGQIFYATKLLTGQELGFTTHTRASKEASCADSPVR